MPRIQPGELYPSVTTLKDAQQSYALYLPSGYTPQKRWPIVYAFDPFARGKAPVELLKEAAEKYGYIIAGSNHAKNGPWKEESEGASAMFQDTHARFSIEDRGIYFAGLSGGARVAAQIALLCRCAAGVFLNGAGFPVGASPSRDVSFAVFSTAGTADFNYPEVIQLQDKLEEAGCPHWLRTFEGAHQWAPKEAAEEALAWFRVVAMAKRDVPQDEAVLRAELERERMRAKTMEAEGNIFAAWREYRQAAATFDVFSADEPFGKEAARLGNEKAVHDGLKHEKEEFEEQERLTREISSGFASLGQAGPDSGETLDQVREEIRSLRERTGHEKHPAKQKVYERALTGVFVQAMEAGNGRQQAKDYDRAANYYELAAEAEPDSSWTLRSLAIAHAMAGDRKAAFAALHKVKEAAKDQASFATWLKEEPAFEKLRGAPEFVALLEATPPQQH